MKGKVTFTLDLEQLTYVSLNGHRIFVYVLKTPAFSCPENAVSLHIMTAFFREHNTYFNAYNTYFNTYVEQA